MKKAHAVNKNFKLMLTIAVPVMVLIVTIAMVGASFAWFTDQATAEISTISLTTRDVFTIVFDTVSSSEAKYQGETAIAYTKANTSSTKSYRYLVSKYRANQLGYSIDSSEYANYLADAPFKFKVVFNLNTDNRYIDMKMDFDKVSISKTYIDSSNNETTTTFVSYGEEISGAELNLSQDKIQYAFTWYMVKHGDTNKYYTPYGIMEYKIDTAGYEVATKLNGTAVTKDTSIASVTPNGITDFYTDGVETFDLYVVFCPEKLYWQQYFPKNRDTSFDSTYTAASGLRDYIVSSGYPNRMYYSATSYWGSEFSFVASINVTDVDWNRTVSGGEE